MDQADVPSPIDLKNSSDAKEWERTAMDRPFRLEFFDQFSRELQKLSKHNMNVLELGSGPGFLADYLLKDIPDLQITLLDFSAAMHELALVRIGKNIERVKFVERNFKEEKWNVGLEKYDAVITNQAIHELRHKRYAQALHEQVRPLLKSNALYLVCDHYCGEGGLNNGQLYMTINESRESLVKAGFNVQEVFIKGGRILNCAT